MGRQAGQPARPPGRCRSRSRCNEGDTLESLSARLKEQGIITHAGVFEWYVKRKGEPRAGPRLLHAPPAGHDGQPAAPCSAPHRPTPTPRSRSPRASRSRQMANRLSEKVTHLNAPTSSRPRATDRLESPYASRSASRASRACCSPTPYQVAAQRDRRRAWSQRMIDLMRLVGSPGRARQGRRTGAAQPVRGADRRLDHRAGGQDRRGPGQDRPGDLQPPRRSGCRCRSMPRSSTARTRRPLVRRAARPSTRRTTPTCTPGCRRPRSPTPGGRRSAPRSTRSPNPRRRTSELCNGSARSVTPCQYLYYVLATEEGGHAFAVTLEQHEANIAVAAGRRDPPVISGRHPGGVRDRLTRAPQPLAGPDERRLRRAPGSISSYTAFEVAAGPGRRRCARRHAHPRSARA